MAFSAIAGAGTAFKNHQLINPSAFGGGPKGMMGAAGSAVQSAQTGSANESPADLMKRYNGHFENIDQWKKVNEQPFNPVRGNPTAPPGSELNPNGQQPQTPSTPLGTPPPGGAGPAGSAVNSGLQGILDQIEKVYSGQNKLAMDESQRAMANRGLGRGDASGNAIYNDALGRVGASKSNAVMQAMLSQQGVDAQDRRFQQEMALKEKMMQQDQQRLPAQVAPAVQVLSVQRLSGRWRR